MTRPSGQTHFTRPWTQGTTTRRSNPRATGTPVCISRCPPLSSTIRVRLRRQASKGNKCVVSDIRSPATAKRKKTRQYRDYIVFRLGGYDPLAWSRPTATRNPKTSGAVATPSSCKPATCSRQKRKRENTQAQPTMRKLRREL